MKYLDIPLSTIDEGKILHWLKAQAFENRTILIKGSRGIQMEQVLED